MKITICLLSSKWSSWKNQSIDVLQFYISLVKFKNITGQNWKKIVFSILMVKTWKKRICCLYLNWSSQKDLHNDILSSYFFIEEKWSYALGWLIIVWFITFYGYIFWLNFVIAMFDIEMLTSVFIFNVEMLTSVGTAIPQRFGRYIYMFYNLKL